MKRVTKPIRWLKFSCFSSGPRIRTDGLNSSSKRGSHFLVPHCLGLLLPSPLRSNQVLHLVSLIFFFLEIIFLKMSDSETLVLDI